LNNVARLGARDDGQKAWEVATRTTSRRKVGIAVENGRLVVEPQRRPRYTLDQLLAQCDSKAARIIEEREWLDAKPVGGELI